MAQKYAIALREAREGKFWSRLLATDTAWASLLEPITQETGEFVAMLTVSVRKLRLPAESGQALRIKRTVRRSRRRRGRRDR